MMNSTRRMLCGRTMASAATESCTMPHTLLRIKVLSSRAPTKTQKPWMLYQLDKKYLMRSTTHSSVQPLFMNSCLSTRNSGGG